MAYSTSRPKSLGLSFDPTDHFSIDFSAKKTDDAVDRTRYKKPALSFFPSSTVRPSVGYHAVTVRPYGESHIALSEQYMRRQEEEKQKQVDLLDDSHFLTQQRTDIGKLPPLNKIPARSNSFHGGKQEKEMLASPTERSVSLRSGLQRGYNRAEDRAKMTDKAFSSKRQRKQNKKRHHPASVDPAADPSSPFDLQRVRRPPATTRRPRTTTARSSTTTDFEHFPSRHDTSFSSLKKNPGPARPQKSSLVDGPYKAPTRQPVQPKPLLPIQDYFGRPADPPARPHPSNEEEKKPFRKSEVDPFFLPRAKHSSGRQRQEFPAKVNYQAISDNSVRPTRSPSLLDRSASREASSGFGFTSQFSAFPHFGSNLGGRVPDFSSRMHPFTSSSFGSAAGSSPGVSQFLLRA